MERKDKYKEYLDFLIDKRFIAWKLLPNEDLNLYWEKFLAENPALAGEMQRAEEYLHEKLLNAPVWSDDEYAEVWQKIRVELARQSKIRRMKRVIFAISAACVAFTLAIGGFYSVFKEKGIQETHVEWIEGNKLEEKNIRLVTGANTIAFDKNTNVEIDENGTAQIAKEGSDKETVNISKNQPNKLIVPYGKRSTITLADGTKVWLNSGSTLEFPAQFNKSVREVRLSGEMYIEVAPDNKKPFYVRTSDFAVQVLGTKFNISVYDNYAHSVALLEGSVEVESKTAATIKLSPNEQAVYMSDGHFRKEEASVTDIISWKDGYLTFNETPITEVLKRIERYYNLSFNYEQASNLQHITCKGKLYLSDNLDNVMNSIAILSASTYRREDNTIYIIANSNK